MEGRFIFISMVHNGYHQDYYLRQIYIYIHGTQWLPSGLLFKADYIISMVHNGYHQDYYLWQIYIYIHGTHGYHQDYYLRLNFKSLSNGSLFPLGLFIKAK